MDGFDQSVNVKVCTSLVIVYLCRSPEVIQWIRIYMWQSEIEIKCYFIAYFECIIEFHLL